MIKSGYNNTSKSKSWNVLETVMSHLKKDFQSFLDVVLKVFLWQNRAD